MTAENAVLFEAQLKAQRPQSVLDMAAARGHFVHYAAVELRASRIVAIEADPQLLQADLLPEHAQVVGHDFRGVELPGTFDLVYSCHTLEHYADPMPHLRFIRDHMHRDSVALIDVPNLDSIVAAEPLDEFFYDKHRTYFDAASMRFALGNVGLEVRADHTTTASIKLLVGVPTASPALPEPDPSRAHTNRRAIEDYGRRLDHNRSRLPFAVARIIELLDSDRPAVLLGAGRVLDAAVKYGGLAPARFDYLVDNYLAAARVTISGRPIVRLADLPVLTRPQVVLMTRTATQDLIGEVLTWNSDAEIHAISAYL